jgi:hypothetical protein
MAGTLSAAQDLHYFRQEAGLWLFSWRRSLLLLLLLLLSKPLRLGGA